MAHFPLLPLRIPLLPLPSPLLPFVHFSTYLAPSSCDRNRPPPSRVACKLTLFAPPFTQLSHPFQIPGTQLPSASTTTTLGPLRSCYAEQKGQLNRVQVINNIHSDYYYYAFIQLVSFKRSSIHYVHKHRLRYTWRVPLAFSFPLLIPLCPLTPPCSPSLSPSSSLPLTWNPPGCDRIRPPRSQVACKLTSPFSPLP
jgi:hypothetical protein